MAKRSLVVCINNEGYPASLELRKLYVCIPDPEAEKDGLIRVIDESGEDYLFSKARFRSAEELAPATKRAVLAAAASEAVA